LTQRFNPYCKK